jgi:hypothetical protein
MTRRYEDWLGNHKSKRHNRARAEKFIKMRHPRSEKYWGAEELPKAERPHQNKVFQTYLLSEE